LVYLIRTHGELPPHMNNHVLGLFLQAVWEQVFAEAGLSFQVSNLDGIYGPYLLAESKYPMKVFIGKKES